MGKGTKKRGKLERRNNMQRQNHSLRMFKKHGVLGQIMAEHKEKEKLDERYGYEKGNDEEE
jgi:hypothetical protein